MVLPLRDDNPTARRAWVTVVLIAINVAVYLLVQPHGNRSVISLPEPISPIRFADADARFTIAYAAVPCELVHARPLNVGEVVETLQDGDTRACGIRTVVAGPLGRLAAFPGKKPYLAVLVSMFLHGGILHIAGNMLFLWIFGNNIEDRFGRFRYLLFYLAAGIVAALAQTVASPSSTVPIIGASGAIAGVMGAYLVFFPRARIATTLVFFPFFVWRMPASWLLAFWFVSQFFVSAGSNVAWMAHVGGFAFGVAVASAVKAVHGGVPDPPSLRRSSAGRTRRTFR